MNRVLWAVSALMIVALIVVGFLTIGKSPTGVAVPAPTTRMPSASTSPAVSSMPASSAAAMSAAPPASPAPAPSSALPPPSGSAPPPTLVPTPTAPALTAARIATLEADLASGDPTARAAIVASVVQPAAVAALALFWPAGSKVTIDPATFKAASVTVATVQAQVTGSTAGRYLLLLTWENNTWAVLAAPVVKS